jgi:hypothetical protein
MEVRVVALQLAREHVKKEIRSKNFKLYEVTPAQITQAAQALLAAPVAMIEQAEARVARWNTKSRSRSGS